MVKQPHVGDSCEYIYRERGSGSVDMTKGHESSLIKTPILKNNTRQILPTKQRKPVCRLLSTTPLDYILTGGKRASQLTPRESGELTCVLASRADATRPTSTNRTLSELALLRGNTSPWVKSSTWWLLNRAGDAADSMRHRTRESKRIVRRAN